MKVNKKCDNCKFSGSNKKNYYGNSACLVGNWVNRTHLKTTNSKEFTHCDKWQLFQTNK